MKSLLITIPVEPWGALNVALVRFLLRVQAHGLRKGKVAVRVEIVEDKPTASCRNRQMIRFLDDREEYALFLDADMVPHEPEIEVLLDGIEHPDVDAISGMAHRKTRHGPLPVLGKFVPGGAVMDGELLSGDPATGPFSLAGRFTGTACFIVKKESMRRFRKQGVLWFKDVLCEDVTSPQYGHRILGHDAYFWQTCETLGLKTWVDLRVCVGHVKPGDLAEEAARLGQALRKDTLAEATR